MRTMPPLWPGVLRSLVDITKCRPSTPLFATAVVTYRADGTVDSAAIPPERLPAGCADTLDAVLRLTIADPVYSPGPGGREVLILPLSSAAVECSSRSDRNVARPIPLGAADGVQPPKRVRNVDPVYPKQLVARGVAGTIVIDSIITSSGCIAEARVLKGVDSQLDFSALVAVSSWEFAPTVVDGRRVPVAMTVDVTFRTR